MSSDLSDVSNVKQNGWRQGSVLRDCTVKELRLQDSGNRTRFVVISHDCDVTNSSLENEPRVELLRAEVIQPSEKLGLQEWGKNPRILDLQQGNEVWRFRIHERQFVDRQNLCNAVPDEIGLSRDHVRSLANWVARRYVREAFPDKFNERVSRAVVGIRRQLKRYGDHLTAIYLQVSDSELGDGVPYEITICGTMREDDYEDTNRRMAAQSVLDALEAAVHKFGKGGIVVRECVLKSEAEVTLADRRMLKRWDFDDLTIRGDGVPELPAGD
jgi:hypothetical protein